MLTRKAYIFLVFLLLFPVAVSFKAFPKENRGLHIVKVGEVSDSTFGDYHALIIGINNYQEWPQLRTAVKDAEGLKDVLLRRYKFPKDQVILKVDREATRRSIIRDLRNLASNLTIKDNLLIYFAGHGQLDDLTGDGFWVPVEGKLKAPDTWISHANIKNILSSENVKAKNIVVVADSCYSGMLLRGGPSLLSVDDKKYQFKLKEMASRRSRQVITSGGLEPVADGGRNGHSLFAYYFLKALEENTRKAIDLENLFHTYVWKPVTDIGGQRPNVGRLKTPMDEDGQFVLVIKVEISGPASKKDTFEKDKNFTAYQEGIVFDSITGLEWIAGPDKDMNWDGAQSWAEGLKIAGGGWRMPTLNELKTLYYKGRGSRNMTPLLETSGWWVWSGEAEDSSSACNFGFLYGEGKTKTARHVSKDGRAFAVRLRASKDQDVKEKHFTNTVGMKFAYIPPGTFTMGSPREDRRGWAPDERQHKVTLSKGFYMQMTEVTQEQWFAVMGTKPWVSSLGSSKEKPRNQVRVDPECPVSWVTWDMCQEFIQKLNEKEGVNTYRLPTESEWEYACRAGSSTRFCFGDDYNGLDEYAWCSENAGSVKERYAHKVGTKKPNPWGLYDMHGNLKEWCADWYGEYPFGHAVDPQGPSEGSERVRRGGGWNSWSIHCRSPHRSKDRPHGWDFDLGFRVVRDL